MIAKRKKATKRARRSKFSAVGLMKLAAKFSRDVGGTKPKYIGEYRFSDKNHSVIVTTYSPENSMKVVCVLSVFENGSTAVSYFHDEGLSELDRYENITHFTYDSGSAQSMRQMVKDLKWVWKTVDGYRASWGFDDED